MIIPPLWMAWTWQDAFYKAMVFMVVASPCAIVSSVMPAILSAISRSARNGVLFKSGACMDLLGEINVVAFDKTGTLTMGTPVVTAFHTEPGYDDMEVLRACAAAESLSQHPLARAVVDYARSQGIDSSEAGEVEQLTSLTGQGIEASLCGHVWRITKADEKDVLMPTPMCQQVRELSQAGNTVSVILCDGQYAGLIAMQDTLRPQAKSMIAKLHDMGMTTVMLTGDRYLTASAIAREAGIQHVYADLLPQDKVTHVSQLRDTCGGVIMVGDGVNDAPALANATVGIAMGGEGSGAALDVADVVLMNDSIEHMVHTIALARRTRTIIKQNLIFAGAVISLLVATNFIQGIPLPLGVVGHEGSTILVILNGLRLLR
ncbi:Zinc-transporting ATPase [compost metagenome]